MPEHSSRGDDKRVVSSEEEVLGRSPGMTTCTSCHQQVVTDITYKVGRFAKMICALFVILGLLMCLVPMLLLPFPLCMKQFKDVHHTCPCCREVLHVEQKRCCQCRT
ncbi:cell death-inducing p53-target protein 1-like [Cyclopterus lumpus]|uniref:cell death-inducing p53-target protein 1-like n=1 Tax=Cyclopterus lumpus TaxID=8103 RepID=UPI0014869FD7|nr:cell death-inducing p53-target protein 1-like [Cyclopterus lumpus]